MAQRRIQKELNQLEHEIAVAPRRIQKELSEWAPEMELAPEGFMAVLHKQGTEGAPYESFASSADLFEWLVVIPGPEDSPYESGSFVLRFSFPATYPFKPPLVHFITPVFHSLFAQDEISGWSWRQWSPASSALQVAKVVQDMLAVPQHDGDEHISHLYSTNRKEHSRLARSCVQRNALQVPQGIHDAWTHMFGPPIVLTLKVSGSSGTAYSLSGTNMGGTQIVSVTVDQEIDEGELRQLLSKQLDVPARRVKLCLCDGTFIHSSGRLDGQTPRQLQCQPISQIFGDCTARDPAASSALADCTESRAGYPSRASVVSEVCSEELP